MLHPSIPPYLITHNTHSSSRFCPLPVSWSMLKQAVGQNLVPTKNTKPACKWMFIFSTTVIEYRPGIISSNYPGKKRGQCSLSHYIPIINIPSSIPKQRANGCSSTSSMYMNIIYPSQWSPHVRSTFSFVPHIKLPSSNAALQVLSQHSASLAPGGLGWMKRIIAEPAPCWAYDKN